MVTSEKLSRYKNILSGYGVFIMGTMALLNMGQTKGIFDIFLTIIIIVFPLGVSDIFWNKKSYEEMIPKEGNFFQKSNFSYRSFVWVGFILILLFDLGMTLGVYNYIK